MNCKLKSTKRDDGWWVTGFPPVGFQEVGPYGTKAEAEEHRVSLQRTLDHWDRPEFWTLTKK